MSPSQLSYHRSRRIVNERLRHNWETNECPPETYDNWIFMQNQVPVQHGRQQLHIGNDLFRSLHQTLVRLDFAVDQFWLNTGLFYSSSQFCLRRSPSFEKGKKNQHWILGMSYMFV